MSNPKFNQTLYTDLVVRAYAMTEWEMTVEELVESEAQLGCEMKGYDWSTGREGDFWWQAGEDTVASDAAAWLEKQGVTQEDVVQFCQDMTETFGGGWDMVYTSCLIAASGNQNAAYRLVLEADRAAEVSRNSQETVLKMDLTTFFEGGFDQIAKVQ